MIVLRLHVLIIKYKKEMISFNGSVTRTSSILLYFVLLESHVMFLAGRYACERAYVCVWGGGERGGAYARSPSHSYKGLMCSCLILCLSVLNEKVNNRN